MYHDVSALSLNRICTQSKKGYQHPSLCTQEGGINQEMAAEHTPFRAGCFKFTASSSLVGLTILTAVDWGLEKKAMK